MFSNTNLFCLLKLINKSCSKRLKHSTVKKTKCKEKKRYTDTVNLPQSTFPVWISGKKRIEQDEKIINECGFATLYNWQRENVTGPDYVLHDGPPYANGMPHMGHAINKILKDITIRHKLLEGHRIHYKPGWDCHGLPIELKAMAGENLECTSPLSIRTKARKFAKDAIRDQKALFRSWGVMADWENGCYFTFDKSYIKNQLQQFYKLYKKGLVYRDVKPVYWSPSSMTALAEAELQYKEDHVSTSVHVRLQVMDAPQEWGTVYALVWTTTPWTLPANQAVAYNPSITYNLVSLQGGEEQYIIAADATDHLAATLDRQLIIIRKLNANELSSLHYKHPLNDRLLPFLPGSHVTADKGTGLVHTAPSHGPDDFKLGKKHNLPILCLVDEAGLFTEEAGPRLSGLPVLTAGTNCVVDQCQELGVLVHTSEYKHSYPYDWRTNMPVILRASHQWFFDTSAVKEQALAALREVSVIPERGMAGLLSQVQTRPFWCISRQRVWGVPVPVVYTSAGLPIISQELIDHYCQLLDSVGDDFWWSCPLTDLVPPPLVSKLNISSSDVERGQDILDIWLDSGLSWSAVLDGCSADLYLEGVDQFNGWFQASLLTSIALQNASPYKKVFVHGFAVDEEGMKMSKSIGNVVNPQDIVCGGTDIKKQPTYGVDTLRWWVAAHATHQASVPVSPTTLADSRDCVQRLRKLMKFMLGALHSLPPHVPHRSLYHLDQYMLHCLHTLESQVLEQYRQFQYNRVCATLTNFVANQVSSVYCHLTKDRLYCEAEDSDRRRAVQLTLFHTLNTLSQLVAPILPVLAEEVYSYHPLRESEFLFHNVGPSTKPEWNNSQAEAVIRLAFEVKQEVVKFSPINCNNWELVASVTAPTAQWKQLQVLQMTEESSDSELAEILQVSRVTLYCKDDSPSLQVQVGLTKAHRCDRCRKHTASAPDKLCTRCEQVVADLG